MTIHQYITIFDISIRPKCVSIQYHCLMYHDMTIYQYIVASLICACLITLSIMHMRFTGQQQCRLVKMIPLLALILRMVIRYGLADVHITDFFVLVCVQIPGVLIFQFIAPLCFTNAQLFMSKLAAACNIDPEKTSGSSESQPGCIEVAFHKVIRVVHAHTHAHTHTHIYARDLDSIALVFVYN